MTIRMTIGLQGRGLRPPEIPVFGLIAWRPLQQFCTTVQTVTKKYLLTSTTLSMSHYSIVSQRICKLEEHFGKTKEFEHRIFYMRETGVRGIKWVRGIRFIFYPKPMPVDFAWYHG